MLFWLVVLRNWYWLSMLHIVRFLWQLHMGATAGISDLLLGVLCCHIASQSLASTAPVCILKGGMSV